MTRSVEPPLRQERHERESVLSLVLRALFWGAVAATVLVTLSPYRPWRWRLPRWPGVGQTQGAVLQGVLLPTPTPLPAARVGIVSGHRGYDAGAVCPNGLTEAEVNYQIARRVQARLTAAGYTVDLLEEKDPRLTGYQAALLLSIHADVCVWPSQQGPPPSGFKLAFAAAVPESTLFRAARLKNCLVERYAALTGLTYHAGSVTPDMTYYHAFDEIDPLTPAVILETGFLANGQDYDLLVNQPDRVAEAIVSGLLCYLRNEPLDGEGGTP